MGSKFKHFKNNINYFLHLLRTYFLFRIPLIQAFWKRVLFILKGIQYTNKNYNAITKYALYNISSWIMTREVSYKLIRQHTKFTFNIIRFMLLDLSWLECKFNNCWTSSRKKHNRCVCTSMNVITHEQFYVQSSLESLKNQNNIQTHYTIMTYEHSDKVYCLYFRPQVNIKAITTHNIASILNYIWTEYVVIMY